jgi:hypothetical protein
MANTRKMVTFCNNFHDTEITVRVDMIDEHHGWVRHRTGRRILRTLCGIDGCMCGGVTGGDGYLDGGWHGNDYDVCL